MQYQVLLQSQNNQFVASVLGFPDLIAEGRTREEALERARTALEKRLAQSELITIEVGAPQLEQSRDVWLGEFGRFRDDPTFDDFLGEVAAARREAEEGRDQ